MFYNKLKEICKRNDISITAATAKLGISKGTASNWKKGGSPNSDIVVQFAKLFNVSTDYFLMEDNTDIINTTSLSDKETLLIERYRSIPEDFQKKIDNYLEISSFDKNTYITPIGYEAIPAVNEPAHKYNAHPVHNIPILGIVAAGKPIEAISNPMGEIQTRTSADFALLVSGNSMYPLIKDSEYVLVKKCDFLENNEIGVFYLDNNVTCKKWFKNDKIIKLISINPAYEDYLFELSDSKNENLNFKVEGKVIFEH